MAFEKHLFISYAHLDNRPTPDDPEGWVSRFHKYLEIYLGQSMGEEARVWRDERLRGNVIFENEIVKQFPRTAVLLSVLSPRYLESDWCLREVTEFCKIAEAHGGVTVDDKTRVIRAMLKSIPAMLKVLAPEREKLLPEVLKNALGYEFYEEAEGKRELPLDPQFGSAEKYKRQIYFLAQDIADLISELRHKTDGAGVTPHIVKPTVYLAECSYDLRDDRERLRGELRAHGYTVLPDQTVRLPDLESEYVAEVGGLLDQCRLAVHFMGKFRGKVADGPRQKPVVELQNEVAAQKSQSSGLRRIIWLPEASRSERPPEHQAFIDALQRDATLQRGADLVTADLEVLKGVIHNTIKQAGKSRATISPGGWWLPLGVHNLRRERPHRHRTAREDPQRRGH